MSDLTDRLRARAEKPETRAQYAGSDALYDIGFGPICDAVDWAILAAHHANLALDLREAADRLDKAEAGLAAWEWAHGVGQSSPPEGVFTVTEGFAGLPYHHQSTGGTR
jgi:hypothetical protein